MSTPYIVFPDGFNKKLFVELIETPELEVHQELKLSRAELLGLGEKVNGVVIRSATTMDKEAIDALPNLKYIIRAGEGTDNIDKKYCEEKGIKVSNTPGANSNSAAEHAIALMLTTLRKTSYAHQAMREGRWDKSLYAGNELWKKTVGFVGFGRIGKIVAKRISGFDPRVIFYDPFIETDLEPNYQKKTLEEIFSESDIITVHVPKTPQTENLVNEKLLSLMKPSSILINAARGGIVDEAALLEALKAQKIRAAGLDVFSKEPLDESSEFRSLDNVVLTPHLGASTEEASVRVSLMAAQQLKEFFIKNNLVNEVKA